MIRVLLADDEAMIRAGVRAILASDTEIEIVAEAPDGTDAVEQARQHRPDVVLLDIRMPRLDGLDTLVELRRLLPETAVVMLTTFGEDEYVARALAGGASGFLLKASDPRELITAVRAVAEGAAYLSPKIAQRVITQLSSGSSIGRQQFARDRVAVLTDRERDVLAHLGRGLSNAEIAAQLYLVEGTVKSYVSAILPRLDVKNRVQAAILAYQAGLVNDDESPP